MYKPVERPLFCFRGAKLIILNWMIDMILNKNKNYFMQHVFLLFQKVFVIRDIMEIC